MKNGYALNSKKEIVSINDILKGDRQTFFCCNCGDIMIPKKGQINIHHFAHKTITCSYESYLHKLAKLKFYVIYSKCLAEKKPFFLEYLSDEECNSCEIKMNITCKFESSFKLLDLTKKFDVVEIEKSVDGFVADVLLSSVNHNEKILIEFAVNHLCTIEKQQSGLRIVEFEIANENSLQSLEFKVIRRDRFNLNFYNFKKKFVRGKLTDPYKCKNSFFFFFINSEGKASSYVGQMRAILSDIEVNEFLYYEIIEDVQSLHEPTKFIQLVKEASRKGIKVMNCHACNFFKLNTKYDQMYPWFCTKHRAEVENSNGACNKMWRIS